MGKHLIFMSSKMTLADWQRSGSLTREILLYKSFLLNIQPFHLCTYGSKADLDIATESGISVLALGDNITRRLSQLPFISSIFHLRRLLFYNLSSYSSLMSLQTSGSWLPLLVSIFRCKRFIYRYGYDSCFFIRKESGFSLVYFYTLLIHFLCISLSNGIVVTSSKDKLRIAKYFPFARSKVFVLPNFVDTDLFSGSGISFSSSLKAIYVGRLAPQKCISDIFKVASYLRLDLTIIGSGSSSELKSLMCNASQYQFSFTHLPHVSNNLLPSFFLHHRIFILMSEYEGNPKALLEAMSSGLICIVKKTNSYDQPVIHNFNGFLIDQSLPQNQLYSLQESLSKPKLLQQISVNARNTIIQHNSLLSYTHNLDKIATNA